MEICCACDDESRALAPCASASARRPVGGGRCNRRRRHLTQTATSCSATGLLLSLAQRRRRRQRSATACVREREKRAARGPFATRAASAAAAAGGGGAVARRRLRHVNRTRALAPLPGARLSRDWLLARRRKEGASPSATKPEARMRSVAAALIGFTTRRTGAKHRPSD